MSDRVFFWICHGAGCAIGGLVMLAHFDAGVGVILGVILAGAISALSKRASHSTNSQFTKGNV